MNTKLNPLRLAIFILLTTGLSGWSQGVIIWDGPTISFNHPDGAGTSVQDQLTPGVALTRDITEGLFNAVTETAYTRNGISPQDTQWAYGSLADYASLGYATWQQWNGRNPPSMVGQPAVVHLISENIYFAITFTSWGGTGGAFTYDRSMPAAVPEPSALALGGLAAGCVLAGRARRKRRSAAQGTLP
jgi:hypothetical protein